MHERALLDAFVEHRAPKIHPVEFHVDDEFGGLICSVQTLEHLLFERPFHTEAEAALLVDLSTWLAEKGFPNESIGVRMKISM